MIFKKQFLSSTKPHILPLALCIALNLFFISPILKPFIHSGHSALLDLARSVIVHQSINEGKLWPDWAPVLYFGYGSPIFTFYSPFSYLIIEGLWRLGFGIVWSTNLLYLFALLMITTCCYFSGNKLFGLKGGMIAGCTAALSPYVLTDLYIRAGIAEFFAIGLFCLTLYLFIKMAFNDRIYLTIFAALSFAAIICSHNITGLLAAGAFIFFSFFQSNRKAFFRILVSIILGIALAAFFWLPALVEKDLVHSTESLTSGDYHFSNHFVTLDKLFIPKIFIEPPAINKSRSPRVDIGLPHMLGFLSFIILMIKGKWKPNSGLKRISIWLGLLAVFSILFMTGLTERIWNLIPLLTFIQFPWRLNILAMPALSILCGSIPVLVNQFTQDRKWPIIASFSVILISVITIFPDRFPGYSFFHNDSNLNPVMIPQNLLFQATTSNLVVPAQNAVTIDTIRKHGITTTAKDDYLPKWVSLESKPLKEPDKLAEIRDNPEIPIEWSDMGIFAEFRFSCPEACDLRIFKFYFPGWKASEGQEEITISPEPKSGIMSIHLEPGSHNIQLEYTNDVPIRKFARILSIISLGFIIALCMFDVAKTIRKANRMGK